MKFPFLAICIAATSVHVAVTSGSAKSLDGLKDLVKRRIPHHASSFEFKFMDGQEDRFFVSDFKRGGILVECTSISACARGLYTYLRERGGVDVWWTGSSLHQLPVQLPLVGHAPITGSSIVKHRYHFNTVTFSYTTAFWSFEETKDTKSNNWSFLLDWLALHGTNLPLAWNGHEYILTQVYREAGLTDIEIRSYFTGPAFQAWQRLGNIQGGWGPSEALPEQWITDQFALQKKIVQRMVSLGMQPVLPAFTGFVPPALHALYPNASIVNATQWDRFPVSLTNVSFLEPFDPLFKTLQVSYLTKQQQAYGVDVSHTFALDQYNENQPLRPDLDYLHNVSFNTIASLQAADPQATWLMQAWMFFSDSAFWSNDRINAYLSGIPNNASIILDLYSEAQPLWMQTESYSGKPWVWCELHGFGGNLGLEGNLGSFTTEPLRALNFPGSSMKGVGLTMEGHEGNEITYALLLDQAWAASPIDLKAYVSTFVSRRYLNKSPPMAAFQAWNILAASVYNNSDPQSQATVKSVFVLAPALTGLTNLTGHHPTKIFYDTNTTLAPALKLLVQASKEQKALQKVPEFVYDVVYLTRQLLANYFINLYQNLVVTYNASDSTAEAVAGAGSPLLEILSDVDDVLMTNENFLLSSWIRSARAWAGRGGTKYANYLEFNARNQISAWGPQAQNNDYAGKDWGGMVRSYYLRRWTMFVDYLVESKRSGTSYNSTAVTEELFKFGRQWSSEIWGERADEVWGTRGDTWCTVDRVLKKWL